MIIMIIMFQKKKRKNNKFTLSEPDNLLIFVCRFVYLSVQKQNINGWKRVGERTNRKQT